MSEAPSRRTEGARPADAGEGIVAAADVGAPRLPKPGGQTGRSTVAALLAIVGAGLLIGGVTELELVPHRGPPIAALDPPRIDFGIVELGSEPVVLRHRLRFENRGGEPMTLQGTAATCGCTAVEPTATVVAPGETLEVEVLLTVGDARPKSSTVRVAFANEQLFTHEFHAIGARSVGLRLLAGPRSQDGQARGVERVWLLATTESDAPPPPPRIERGSVIGGSARMSDFVGWEAIGGGDVARAPHHWIGEVDIERGRHSTRRAARAALQLESGGMTVRIGE